MQAFRRSQTSKGRIIIIYAHTNVPPTQRRFCKPFISTQRRIALRSTPQDLCCSYDQCIEPCDWFSHSMERGARSFSWLAYQLVYSIYRGCNGLTPRVAEGQPACQAGLTGQGSSLSGRTTPTLSIMQYVRRASDSKLNHQLLLLFIGVYKSFILITFLYSQYTQIL